MKKSRILLFLLPFCLLGSFGAINPIFGIRYTVTPSLPYKLFISRPCTHIAKNQFVSIIHPHSEILLAKQIIGVAGDTISIRNKQICINDQSYGLILERSKSGLQFHPITEMEIPDDCVFVYAPHEESFDSRYQEFGLIQIDQIKESLWPLF